jgi:hypothetical protein
MKDWKKTTLLFLITYLILQIILGTFWIIVEKNEDIELKCVAKEGESMVCFPFMWISLAVINIPSIVIIPKSMMTSVTKFILMSTIISGITYALFGAFVGSLIRRRIPRRKKR